MSFLSVPLKKTSQIDISGPLNKYSKKKFPSIDHSVAINEFAQLRKNVADRCVDKTVGNQGTLDALIGYYDQLLAAEKKLPISENEIRIEFKWYDGFSRDSMKQFAVAYEKACVLFNIAAAYTQLACSATVQEGDEQLKSAAKYFQQAAGIFTWLRENPTGFITNQKADLSSDVLLTLNTIMLAQAQELFYKKAYNDKLRDASAARLAAQVAEYYHQAMQQIKVADVFGRDWYSTANAKYQFYQGCAEYHQAAACAADQRFGEQIARLQQAYELAQSAEKMADSSSPLKRQAKEHVARVKQQLDAAVKDNDFIYHEPIPKSENLSAISRAALAKAIAPETPFNKEVRDLFSDMVPLQVAESMTSFESRRDAIIQAEVTRLRDATSFLNTVLASLGLPAALDEICGTDHSGGKNMSLPTTLLTSAEKIRQAGGAASILRDISEIPSLYSRNNEIVTECLRMLDDEQASDDKLRNEFGAAKWTRTPSANLTKSMRDDIGRNKQTLDVASQADQVVRQKWESHREGLELLSKSPTDIISALPGNNNNENVGIAAKMANNPAVRDLKECLDQIEGIKADRDNIEILIKEQRFDGMQETFLEALMRDGAIDEEELSNAKLNERFTTLREQITASLQKQEEHLNKLQSLHAKFLEERQRAAGGAQVNNPAAERDRMLGRLQGASAAFTELENHLKEGKHFYAKMTEALLKLQSSISDFTFARKTEKEDLMLSIQQQAVGSRRQQETNQQAPTTQAHQQPPPVPPQPAGYPGAQQQTPYPPQYPVQPGAPPPPPAQYGYGTWPGNPNQPWGGMPAPGGQLPYPPQPGQNPYYPQYFPPPR